MKNRMNLIQYRKLKKMLGRGEIKIVHELFNNKMKQEGKDEVSYELVVRIINGTHHRQDILDFAIDHARKVQDQKTSSLILASNRIDELVSK